jgi:tetratricopeptide (TPR) repeat protein
MAGRWIRKCSLTGCLVIGAFGCNRNSVQQLDAQPVSGVPMTSASPKPWWSGSTPQPAAEPVAEAPKKGPAKPETDVAFSDVKMDVAFDEKTPEANRSALLDQARHGYQKALQQDPKNKAALLGLARYYARLNEREKALETYQKYLAIYPTDREVVHEIAVVFARWKDWSNSVAWCERALKLDPENLTFRKTMAFCLARGGRWEDAFGVLLTMMPEAQARYNIARVLEHQNFPDATRQQLQLALKADPNYLDAREFLTELDQGTHTGGAVETDPNAIQRAGYVPEQ